jgi:hypothetical protein
VVILVIETSLSLEYLKRWIELLLRVLRTAWSATRTSAQNAAFSLEIRHMRDPSFASLLPASHTHHHQNNKNVFVEKRSIDTKSFFLSCKLNDNTTTYKIVAMASLCDIVPSGVITGDDVLTLFEHARANSYAIPAVNCTRCVQFRGEKMKNGCIF